MGWGIILALTPPGTVCALDELFLTKGFAPAYQEEALCKDQLLSTYSSGQSRWRGVSQGTGKETGHLGSRSRANTVDGPFGPGRCCSPHLPSFFSYVPYIVDLGGFLKK